MCDCTTAAHALQKEAKCTEEGQGMVRVHRRVLVWPLVGTRMCAVGSKVTNGVFRGAVPVADEQQKVPSSV